MFAILSDPVANLLAASQLGMAIGAVTRSRNDGEPPSPPRDGPAGAANAARLENYQLILDTLDKLQRPPVVGACVERGREFQVED
jgi:methionine salvage enolase-phosphatase E1